MNFRSKRTNISKQFSLLVLVMVLCSLKTFSQTSTITVVQAAMQVHPLERVTLISRSAGTISVTDGQGREYFRSEAASEISFIAGGTAGTHTVTLTDKKGNITGKATFQLEAKTKISDGAKIEEMFNLLHNGMLVYSPKGYEEITWKGRPYRYFVNWVLDNNNTTKGMQYFSPYSRDMIDLFRENQQPNGMIWSFALPNRDDYHYYETAYSPLHYFNRDNDAWFVRQPNENHVEYNFVNLMYQHWKASGDNEWMRKNLECAARALDYSVTDTVRWSKRFQLLKRPYTIDSWDFQVDDEYTPPAPLSPTMVVVPGKTKYGIFFGDNTGYFEACSQLAEMFTSAGNKEKAEKYTSRGREIMNRLITLSWNGKYFTHFIDEDASVKRNLGVDEKSQIAQGNMYSINRGLSHEMNVAIIKTYQELKKNLPAGSPGEWYAIYPPFEKGFGSHNSKWQYMNGGVAGHGIGELARGAYENGYEAYASDIMYRMLDLIKKYNNRLWFAYTGSIPPAPAAPEFRTLDLSAQANMDTWDKGSKGVFTWMGTDPGSSNDMRNLPIGEQVFQNIRFRIADPEKNNRRVAIAVSTKPGFPRQKEVPVNDTASCVYLLHSSSDNIPGNVAGAITFVYADGSEASQYIFKFKEVTNWWFAKLNNEKAGVAWAGPNPKSTRVGVCWAAIDNPFPAKKIIKLVFTAPLEGGIYSILAVSLANKPFYIAPKGESFGGPDNWAAANAMAALVEGLAGVKNSGLAFSSVALSPRWTSSGTDSVKVEINFPASNGYVSYQYQHSQVNRRITLLVTGSGKEVKAHVLLPAGINSVKQVTVGEKTVPFRISTIEGSSYIDFDLSLPAVQKVEIFY